MTRQLALWTILALTAWGAIACSDPVEQDVDVDQPCDGACPAEQCVLGNCVDPNNDGNNDVNNDAPDADDPNNDAPDADEPDADEPDADEPDADEPDADEGCRGDEDCAEGQICDDGQSPAACRPGCRQSADCPQGQRCDEDSAQCVDGCAVDDDCGRPESFQGCDVEQNTCVPVECRVDNQCSGEQFCDQGPNTCQDGCREGGCPLGQFCDVDSRQCTFGCVEDAGCELGFYCDDATRTCLDGCRDDNECTPGEVCVEVTLEDEQLRQRCQVPTCQADADCDQGEFCGADPDDDQRTICRPGCRAEPDNCPRGQVCDPGSRQCRVGCAEDADCAQGFICDQDAEVPLCVVGCREDAGCAEGQSCQVDEGRCSCTDNAHCFGGEVCVAGACTPTCEGNGDCAQGEVCHPEFIVCVPACRSDEDCDLEAGEFCDINLQLCQISSCASDIECADGEYCDLILNPPACREGCRFGQCPEGQICDPDQRQCIDGCAVDNDCAPGDYCDPIDGCVAGCRDSFECPNEQICENLLIDEALRQRCVLPVCARDADCTEAEFCGDDPVFEGRTVCLPGCRTNPDNCFENETCDPQTRVCIGEGCNGDNECALNQICAEATPVDACRAGCRQDGDCAEGFGCDPEVLRCACVTNIDCPQGQKCQAGLCVDPCAADSDCPQGQRCEPDSRECVAGCIEDGDCGVGQVCDPGTRLCLGRLCQNDVQCPTDHFCDIAAQTPRCAPGCREGGCDQGEFCDLQRRQCVAGCETDDGCPQGSYCDLEERSCLEGCRSGDECDGDEVCERVQDGDIQRQLCVAPSCNNDDACLAEEFCGINVQRQRQECQTGCRTAPDSCPDDFACNGQTRRCESTVCQEDGDCGDGRICVNEDGRVQCRVGCRNNDQCVQGGTCNIFESRCICGQNSDCFDGQVCDRGACIEPCGSDDDCLGDEVCNQLTGQCTIGCTTDGECGGRELGFFCDQLTRTCQALVCTADSDCPDFQFCDVLQDPGRCTDGCRANSCPFGLICDLDSRQCVEGCAQDDDCVIGFFCDAQANTCRPGCRNNNDCAVPGERLVCDPQERQCLGLTCTADSNCGERQFCDLEAEVPRCALGCRLDGCPEGQFCEAESRQCQEGCLDDQTCPDGFFCDIQGNTCRIGCRNDEECGPGLVCLDQLVGDQLERLCLPPTCNSDEDCAPDQFCGFDQFREVDVCLLGCRTEPDSCPDGQGCNPVTRLCVQGAGCQDDGDCLEGEICIEDQVQNFCEVGCRDDAGCFGDGLCIVDIAQCGCLDSTECFPGQACDPGGVCIRGCAEDAQCPEGQSCDTNTGLCFEGDCLDDFFEPNNELGQAPPLEPGQVVDLRMCYLEPPPERSRDCFNLFLNPGPFTATATFSHADGNLDLFLFDPGQFVTGSSQSTNDNETIQVTIEFGGFYSLCVQPAGNDPFQSSYTLGFTLE